MTDLIDVEVEEEQPTPPEQIIADAYFELDELHQKWHAMVLAREAPPGLLMASQEVNSVKNHLLHDMGVYAMRAERALRDNDQIVSD